jgi:adenylate cyclase
MNPNICTNCEGHFQPGPNKKFQSVAATVLFADIRGYTTLSLHVDAETMARLLSQLYDGMAQAIWDHDGVVNKYLGDAVLAIFDFPIVRADAVSQAIAAGQDIIRVADHLAPNIHERFPGHTLAVGVGIHVGDLMVGRIGEAGGDVTAIGPTVNLAARLQAAAQAGEVLVSANAYQMVTTQFPGAELRGCDLKGIPEPVPAYALRAA